MVVQSVAARLKNLGLHPDTPCRDFFHLSLVFWTVHFVDGASLHGNFVSPRGDKLVRWFLQPCKATVAVTWLAAPAHGRGAMGAA